MDTLSSELLLPSLPARRKSGRAACTERGDAIWEWQVATGVFERDITLEQLKRLEAQDLEIIDTFAGSEDSGRWIHDSRPCQPGAATRRPTSKPRARRSGPIAQIWARLRGAG